MNEVQATAIAKALGGESWQSGGNIWLVILRDDNGRMVVFSDEVICEYANDEAFDEGNPSQSILLPTGAPQSA